MYKTIELTLNNDYLICDNCACCYDQEGNPTYCQVFCHPNKNKQKAQVCEAFIPKGVPRDMVKPYENERPYERIA